MNKLIITRWSEFRQLITDYNLTDISLDFECRDASYLNLEVAGWSICNGKVVFYVDILDNKQKRELINLLLWLLGLKVKTLIMHNSPFDMRILKQLDISHTDNIYCTMTAAHLLDENKPKGLKWLAENVLHKKRETIKFIDAISSGFSSTKFYNYATDDAIDTWELYQHQLPELRRQGLWNLWHDIERPFQFCLRDLSMNGVLVDKPKLLGLQTDLAKEVSELEIQMYEAGGIGYYTQYMLDGTGEITPEVNLNSPKQLIDLLQGLGVELTETTESGQLTTKNSVLEKAKHQHPFVQLLLEYRTLNKLLNAFLNPLPKFIEDDGRIRPHFHNTVTVTGRLSCSAPNLQQIPK